MLFGLRRPVTALAALPLLASLSAKPGYGKPLPLTRGETTTVATVSELRKAINTATAPSTILLANGTYTLDGAALHVRTDGLVIRSASGNRDKVILRGPDEGPKATTPHVFLVPASDVGIGLEHADHVTVENNTVFITGYRGAIEYRFTSSSDLVFRNNLSNHPILARNEPPPADLAHNVGSARPEWFADLTSGDLHLTGRAKPALDAGKPLDTLIDDIDGDRRPTGDSWDIGADEFQHAIE